MNLYVKNMVCNRCILVVKTELERLHLHPAAVSLGEVVIEEEKLPAEQLKTIDLHLRAFGFELIDSKKSRMIEKIKTLIVDTVHYREPPKEKYSTLISGELHYDYPYLSKLFSDVEGITIEQYIINQKVEKIKEYIVYNELSLSEIADRMGYSSVAALSAQFKKVTGLPPSHFKNIGVHQRRPLDDLRKR